MARSRSRLQRALRDHLEGQGYLEVETPIAVPFAGQEPHLRPFETTFTPDPPVPPGSVRGPRRLQLHTSPEYAMKRLLARDGFARIFQIARVFRDGEISVSHNPEFTLLEMYASPGDANAIMAEVEALVAAGARALRREERAPARRGHGRGERGPPIDLTPSFERLSCRDAFERFAGFDPLPLDAEALAQAARAVGVRPSEGASWDDVFTQVLLEKVEPSLGIARPTFLVDYPASQAALARLKPSDPRVAERFELYAAGLELANGFSELTDAREQRSRLEEEQGLRARLGRGVWPLDERFLEALDRIPSAGGVAIGFDRLLMLLTGAASIAEVLLFPAAEEYPEAEEPGRS
ncbi:MAG: EF-P lysine aminoacylase GenX [Deltaproteobacteria bacterium]|nr:MAG: EF-P lysine aminoacylase GenX [Deltaproteobacteria bacterium]